LLSVSPLISLAIVTLEAFAGVWINAFIVCVLCIGWVNKKTLNSNEKILLLLGCSRFWYLGISWLYSFLLIIYPYCFCVPLLLESLAGFQSFFDCSNIWLSACLCVLYCKKIANFSNSFFIYLKLKIDKIVPWFLLGSVLLAFSNNLNITCFRNFLEESIRKDKLFFSSFFLLGFGYAVSFMAVIFSAVFLLFSLWKHKQKMQTNSMKDLSVEAHIRAMKSILSFLVMYSINFVCLVLILFYIMANVNIVTILANIYVYGFPGVHSVVLILSNPQLEKALFASSRKSEKSWNPCKLLVFHFRK
uniref:Taste receptor type 2 n=1 Tax=Catharus ustulatus TaxID=91951 RepID=A0A8C3TYR9_CATUS